MSSKTSSFDNQPRTILVVDDDKGIRESLCKRFEHVGYRVLTAPSGTDAINTFEEQGADLIVLDVKMPGIDGFETCEIIRKKSEVPIIFVTGVKDSIVQTHLPKMVDAVRGDYYLKKPFEMNLLLTLVDGILKQ